MYLSLTLQRHVYEQTFLPQRFVDVYKPSCPGCLRPYTRDALCAHVVNALKGRGRAQALIMASATPAASVRGKSTAACEDRSMRGCRRHAAWPHVADAVIETSYGCCVLVHGPRGDRTCCSTQIDAIPCMAGAW